MITDIVVGVIAFVIIIIVLIISFVFGRETDSNRSMEIPYQMDDGEGTITETTSTIGLSFDSQTKSLETDDLFGNGDDDSSHAYEYEEIKIEPNLFLV